MFKECRILTLSLFLLVGCATGGRDERFELRNYFKTKALDLGLKFLDESKFYKDEKERLLFLMEKSVFLHQKGEFLESNKILQAAKELSQNLYTISLSNKIEEVIVNDNSDKYYGDIYEISMLYFYSSLNCLQLYNQTGSRDDLFKARAEILAWDSFLNSIKDDRVGKTVYKKDLVLKLYGAKIHELIGTREDEQIAKNLYQEALEVVLKNYNTYPAFNRKYLSFKKDYSKLPSLKLDILNKEYIEPTEHQANLKSFIEKNLERLKQKKHPNRVTIIFENELIAEKIADKTAFGLQGMSNEPFFRFFIADVLGMTPGVGTYNPSGIYAGVMTADAAMKLFTFSFEVPKIKNTSNYSPLLINVYNLEKKLITSEKLNLLNPMGDIAEEAVLESSAATYTRVGARLATKHLAAITASFATYRALGGGKGKDNLWPRNAAILQYAAATRLIEESERADTRYWSTLPNEIRMTDLSLTPGEYEIELVRSETDKIILGKIFVDEKMDKRIFQFRN
jgi:hypothetical protein